MFSAVGQIGIQMHDRSKVEQSMIGAEEPPVALDDAELGRLILDSALDYAFVTLSPDGIVTSWSAGAERILGWTEEEIIGRPADAFFTPEDINRKQPEFQMALAIENGRAMDERWHIRKDGTRFFANGLMMPILNDAGSKGGRAVNTSGFLKIFRDQTDRFLIEQRAKNLESSVTAALSSSGRIGLHRYDMAAGRAYADEQTAEFFGLDHVEAANGLSEHLFFAKVHPEDVDWLQKEFKKSVGDTGYLDVEYRIETAGRWPRWVNTLSTIMPGDDGKLTQLSGMTIDITARKYEQSMQAALLKLGDTLRDEDDPAKMAQIASQTLGETMGVTRAGFGELDDDGDTITIHDDWNTEGSPSIAGVLKYSDFGEFNDPLLQGQIVVMTDCRADGRVKDPAPLEGIAVRALVNVPLMHQGRLKAVMFVNDSMPRKWTDAEVNFARGVFDRTFAAVDHARSEIERDLLNAELAHRMKNVLTMAQVVATQSLRHANSVEEGHRVVSERLGALGRAQEMLTHEKQKSLRLRAVIANAMAPHLEAPERISCQGPSITLPAQQVLGISLALHELVTNASKYGALSTGEGCVEIRWDCERDGAFFLEWKEIGGPPVEEPENRGFGSTILDRVAGGYFSGTSKVSFNPEGVVFCIEGKLDMHQVAAQGFE